MPVWEKGITGRGIKVVVLDDGVEGKHSDLIHSYVRKTNFISVFSVIKILSIIYIIFLNQ